MNWTGRVTGICVAISLGLALIPSYALSQSDGGPIFKSEDIIRSTVRVVAYDAAKRRIGWGTGWIISASDNDKRAGNAIVVTTWNTIKGSAGGGYVKIIPGGGGDELPARIRSTKSETKNDFDMAFIEVKGLAAPALKVASSVPDSARPVYSSGYSFVADTNEAKQWSEKASIQSGTVSKVFEGGMTRASQAPVNQIEHNTPLDPGFSGGPLIDRCGNVVGVNTKDGGLRIGEDLPVALSKGSRFALEKDELISVANQEGVPFVAAEGDCSAMGVAASAPAVVATAAAVPTTSASGLGLVSSLRENKLAIGALVVLALALVAFGLRRVLGAKRPSSPAIEPTRQEVRATGTAVPGSAPKPAAATPTAAKGTVVVGPSIELAGRGPDGQAVSYRFASSVIGKSGISIGSDPASVEACVDNRADYKVSRLHARLGFDGSSFTLEDLRSTNGTKVGGERLEANKLKVLIQGDDVEFADIKLKVSIR